LIPV